MDIIEHIIEMRERITILEQYVTAQAKRIEDMRVDMIKSEENELTGVEGDEEQTTEKRRRSTNRKDNFSTELTKIGDRRP